MYVTRVYILERLFPLLIVMFTRLYQESAFDLPRLSKPLRPVWISPDSPTIPHFESNTIDFYPVICLSASEHVESGVERRNGYSYVQGSGDDHESWSKVRYEEQIISPSELLTSRSCADSLCPAHCRVSHLRCSGDIGT